MKKNQTFALRASGIGVLCAALLFGAYAIIVTAISGASFAQQQIEKNWPWLFLLTIGFGTQIALLLYGRWKHTHVHSGCTVASGATSTTAMLLCCTHYIATFFPVLSALGIVAVVDRYQTFFFELGVLANATGIVYVSYTIWPVSVRRLLPLGSAVAAMIVVFGLLYTFSTDPQDRGAVSGRSSAPPVALVEKELEKNGITVSALPRAQGDTLVVAITMNNHVVNIDEDMASIATLRDADGNTFTPRSWNGDPPGGHHREGELVFDGGRVSSPFTLALKQVGGVPNWQFVW